MFRRVAPRCLRCPAWGSAVYALTSATHIAQGWHWPLPPRRHSSTKPLLVPEMVGSRHLCRLQADAITNLSCSTQQASQTRHFFDKSEFVYSAEQLRHHPANDHVVPEIVILGASNAGKSTLLNRLFNKTNMARVSNQPGKTTLMNAYGVGKPLTYRPKTPKSARNLQYGLIMMDTPGYGFGSRVEWGTTILSYLEKRKALRGALLLLSAEKNLGAEDEWILKQLAHASTRLMVILTKADKVESARRTEHLQQLAKKVRHIVERIEEEFNVKIQLEICVTSHLSKKASSQDMSGLRLAIMELASLSAGKAKVEQSRENTQYTGEVVSFDDIKWKT